MATIKIYDRANEYRVEIVGRFAGDSLNEVENAWKSALRETMPRQFTVDITRLTSYDNAGCLLLREMYRHGAQFAAGTPVSLVFLGELSKTPRRGPALVQEASPSRLKKQVETAPRVQAIASGQ